MALSQTDLNGLFKQVYTDDIINLVPKIAFLQENIDFAEAELLGQAYNQPVIVTNEQGFTYGGNVATAFALNSAVSMQMENAQIAGNQVLLRSSMAYGVGSRAQTAGKAAFKNAVRLLFENMVDSMGKRVEVAILYGQVGLGNLEASTDNGSDQTILEFSTGEWAAGIWSGSEKTELNFYNGTVLVSSGADAIFTIAEVDPNAKTITVTGTNTGIAALDSAVNGTPGAVAPYYRGAFGNEMVGLKKIITNTTTLFNVDAATYDMWRGNTATAGGGELTLQKLLQANAKAVARGLDSEVTVLVSPATWNDLNNDEAALRMYDDSYKGSRGERGVQALTYNAQNGRLNVVSHTCVKEGDAFIVPLDEVKRIGSMEPTFITPGKDGEMFLQLTEFAGFELRRWMDQAVFVEYPAHCVYINNIVNSSI